MKYFKLAMSLVLILSVITVGYVLAQDGDPQSGGVLQAAHDAEWTGLDPHVSSTVSSFHILDNVVESLTAFNDNIELGPQLATEWSQSEDGLTWTFTLREGVMFSNGEEMTAEDVVWSMSRILDPATGSGRVANVGGEGAVWVVVDDYTVSVTTTSPNAILPVLLADNPQGIIHADSVNENGQVVVPIGTGPFVIEDLEGTTSMRLVKNENYWQEGLPYLDAVEVTVIQEAASREAALLGGEVDFVNSLAPQSVQALMDDPSVEVQTADALNYYYIGINVTREPLDNPLVRQAIAYAIDRQQICEAAEFGLCEPIQGPIGAGSPWYFDYAPYDQDLDRARELLAEAGYPDGFEMELLPTSTYQETVRAAQVLQAQLAQVGITATINAPEWAEWLELEGNFQYDGYICSWNGLTDAHDYYFLQHHTGEVFNFTGYSNPEFDTLVEEGREISDFDERYAIYEQANQILVDDAPYIYFYNGQFVRAHSPNVNGYVLRADNQNSYVSTWLGDE